ncbi:MAG TPA: ABC transporter permease [Streptosporangiaceae bacterium]|nr:ABC transporter permease [Streptosporangiaceae bacterium]
MTADPVMVLAESRKALGARARSRVRSPIVWLSIVVMAGVLVMAIFGALIAPLSPSAQHLSITDAPPSAAHWLGTDSLGRDVFSRVIAGARSAFFGPLVIAAASFFLGNLLGLFAGYRGGLADAVIMRWVDFMWSLPSLVILVVVAGAVGSNYWLAVLVLIILTVPFDTRVIRGAALEQRPRPYVEAAQTLGVPRWKIMAFHVWPNVSPVAVANTCLVFAGSLVTLAGLAFLGLGLPPGIPDWGLMLSQNEALLFTNPLATIAPGVMIVLTAISMNLIGDWLYEHLASQGGSR